ncbi:MAG: M20/M25/M40 family metallo-hydrolase [Oscillospiraceae bacterium]|nr:M20/M25/M40 family metallo-hydrolase [Oscillospiraceae bacterium]
MIGYILLALIAVFFAIVLIRTLNFNPKAQPEISDEEITFSLEKAVNNLAELVRCKTISYVDSSREDDAEFRKLIDKLPTLYPHVFSTCTFQELPDRALLFKWPGVFEGDPTVLMAHYDVVPVNEENWEKPPFAGFIDETHLWGRGTLDTKVTMNGVLTAADHLISEGFQPESDIYFAFSGGEEISGPGAANIVELFREKGITPALVVDEGGAVVENVFPGVKQPCGLIGLAEKGMLNAQFRCMSAGGHASAPKPHTPVGILAKACCKVENTPFKSHIEGPAAQMFDTLGRHSNFLYRMIFANLWCFGWVIDLLGKTSGGEMNAIIRTTVAFTQMEGSSAANVIPPEAKMVANIRLNPADSVESALNYLRKTVGDDSIEISAILAQEPSRVSTTDCDGWNRVAASVAETWPGCIVSPYLMVQGSDSRHWGAISDKVYRFSAMDLTKEERASIHGNNERIRLETVGKAVEFYIRLMKKC